MSSNYAYKKIYMFWLAYLVDSLGYLVRKPDAKRDIHPKKILVVRLDQLGDIVQSIPVFKNLRNSFPGCQVDALTTPGGETILNAADCADNIHVWNCSWFQPQKRTKEKVKYLLKNLVGIYDVGFDLRGDIRIIWFLKKLLIRTTVGYGATGGGFLLDIMPKWKSEKHAIEKNLELVRAVGGETSVNIPIIPVIKTSINSQFKLCVHPDAGTQAKKWPIENFVRLIIFLQKIREIEIILVGYNKGMGEKIIDQLKEPVINQMGKTSLPQLLEVLSTSDGLLSNDSGPAHIMAAMGRQVWIIWSGTAASSVWAPRGDKVEIIENQVSCAPCSLRFCPVPGHPCINEISVQKVFNSISKVIIRYPTN